MVEKTPSTKNHFGGATPFKIQVNFHINLIEVHIYVDALEKWLKLSESYYSVKKIQ